MVTLTAVSPVSGGGVVTLTAVSPVSGGSGWAAFGVVLLVMALLVSVAGVGLWYARRRRLRWLPVWLQGPRGAHHSVENLAYSRHKSDGCVTTAQWRCSGQTTMLCRQHVPSGVTNSVHETA